MKNIKLKNQKRDRRKKRNRAKVFGTETKPRLSVFRSNKHITAQLIDDQAGKTLVYAFTKELKGKKGTKTELSRLLGELVAEKAQKLGIKSAVFNKGPYLYHGRIKAVAEGARAKGLEI